uniref:F-box protein 16 n=1 Tax=Oryzias melastigma TaxID=30732 RepID=A0A3B3C6H4_ORYME
MQTKRSAWTPMNHLLANTQVFQFNRWSDSQRKAVLQDLLLSCAEEQLRFLSLTVSRRLPLQAADFTCLLPRVICLYIFSFLDPRSLCRCARVHALNIVELDQLWMPKCLKLGWCVDFSPTAFEQGVWKRHYIQTAQDLQRPLLKPLIIPDPPVVSEGPELATEGTTTKTRSRTRLKQETPVPALPPWRDSDRCPKDIVRFNYLNNLDPMEQALRAKKDDGGRKTLSESAYKLRKAKSLVNAVPLLISATEPHHPSWASRDPGSWLRLAQWNAGIRPRPVRTAVPQLGVEALRALRRSHRSIPS